MGDIIKMIADLLGVSEAEVEWVFFSSSIDPKKLQLAEEAVDWYLWPRPSFKKLKQLSTDLPITTPGFYVIVHKAFEAIVQAKMAAYEEEMRQAG